jgi:signal transduction histidine kinase
MSTVMAVLGWVVGGGGWALAAARGQTLDRRMEDLARASHELRRPLTAARLALWGADGRAAAAEAELRRVAVALEDLDAIRAAGRARGRPFEPLSLQDLATRCAKDAGVACAAAAEAAEVFGDAARLQQACANLIANALEHGASPVEVRVRRAGDRARVEVHDHGPGLPEPVREIVRRARAGNSARGRGLAIATDIARRHGGCLTTAPSPTGSCVVLDLPAAGARVGLLRRRSTGS